MIQDFFRKFGVGSFLNFNNRSKWHQVTSPARIQILVPFKLSLLTPFQVDAHKKVAVFIAVYDITSFHDTILKRKKKFKNYWGSKI